MALMILDIKQLDLSRFVDSPLGRALNEVAAAFAASMQTGEGFAARLNSTQRTSLKIALCKRAGITLEKVTRTYPETYLKGDKVGQVHPRAGESYTVTRNPNTAQVEEALTTLSLRHISDGSKIEEDGKTYLTSVITKLIDENEDEDAPESDEMDAS